MRKDILTNMREILKILKKGELSIKQIAYKANMHWETAVKALEFLEEVGLVKERPGTENKRKTRLFRLK